jgi:hypothetical protein
MPKLGKLSEDLAAAGLVVIGAHAQGGSDEEVRATARSHGGTYPIVKNAQVKDGNDFRGIPHVILFDHTGKCVYRGSPSEAEKRLPDLLGKALIAGEDGKLLSKVAPAADLFRKGQPMSAVSARVVSLAGASDKTTAAEAKQVLERLNASGDKLLESATALKETDPVLCQRRITRLAADLKSTSVGKKAADELAKLKRDKKFAAEVSAFNALEIVRAMESRVQPPQGNSDPKSPAFQQANGVILVQMQSSIRKMKKSWPETKATGEALAIAEKYGLKVN